MTNSKFQQIYILDFYSAKNDFADTGELRENLKRRGITLDESEFLNLLNEDCFNMRKNKDDVRCYQIHSGGRTRLKRLKKEINLKNTSPALVDQEKTAKWIIIGAILAAAALLGGYLLATSK